MRRRAQGNGSDGRARRMSVHTRRLNASLDRVLLFTVSLNNLDQWLWAVVGHHPASVQLFAHGHLSLCPREVQIEPCCKCYIKCAHIRRSIPSSNLSVHIHPTLSTYTHETAMLSTAQAVLWHSHHMGAKHAHPHRLSPSAWLRPLIHLTISCEHQCFD